MASGVRVVISDELIISALNLPGRPVANWRDRTGEMIVGEAIVKSPVNDPLNARHRAGWVGEFQQSWYWDRYGNQHRVGARIGNVAHHALYVEEGRSASFKRQTFSWTAWGGETRTVGHDVTGSGTSARPGKHVLRNAVNTVMPSRCGGFTPLV